MNEIVIVRYLAKNNSKAYTSKALARATRMSLVSTQRALRQLKKNRIKVTKRRMPGCKAPVPFYHYSKRDKIIKFVYGK